MIHTSRQLKDLVRNISKSDSTKAQIIIRNYIMERFLERLSLSPYRNNFILKGGILVSAMVGLDARSTLDVDATIKNYPLSMENASKMVSEIALIPIDDGITFQLKGVDNIIDEVDYGGVRVSMEALLDKMRTPLKIDVSTGDVITPHEISYAFKLMFEERTISLLAYNLETVLAEKLETVISRRLANTRMRDYYDLYILQNEQAKNIDKDLLKVALANTCKKRNSTTAFQDVMITLGEIEQSEDMQKLWSDYGRNYSYAKDIHWVDVINSIRILIE